MEGLILDRIEAEDTIRAFSIPNVGIGDGSISIPFGEYKEMVNNFLPWLRIKVDSSGIGDIPQTRGSGDGEGPSKSIADKIASLRKLAVE